MPDSIELAIQVPEVPEGFCNNLGEDWIQAVINLMGQSVAIFTGAGTIVLNQEDAPDPEERSFLWFKPSTGRIYAWDAGGGAWTSPHPLPANGIERRFLEGTPAEIWAYDGGDGSDPSTTAPAANVGAMWIIDTAYAGRVPMGVGTIPGSDPSKNLALSEDYGAGSVEIKTTNLPELQLTFPMFIGDDSSGSTYPTAPHTTSATNQSFPVSPNPLGDGTPLNITNPVRGGYWCKRSARTNYVAA